MQSKRKATSKSTEDVFVVTEMVAHHYLMTAETFEKYKKANTKKRKTLPLVEITDERKAKLMKKYPYSVV